MKGKENIWQTGTSIIKKIKNTASPHLTSTIGSATLEGNEV